MEDKKKVAMAKEEGNIYEAIARIWFESQGFRVLEYHGSRGTDFIVETPYGVRGYEVKGKQLIDTYRKERSFRVTGISIKNVEMDRLTNFLLIIYDNFADRFRIFDIPRERVETILPETRGWVSIYSLLDVMNIKLFDVKDVDIESRLQNL